MNGITSKMENLCVTDQYDSCTICGKTDVKISRCSKCRFTNYCSTTCQKQDWPRHKTVCNEMAKKGAKKTFYRSTSTIRGKFFDSTTIGRQNLHALLAKAADNGDPIVLLEDQKKMINQQISFFKDALNRSTKLNDKSSNRKGFDQPKIEASIKLIAECEKNIIYFTRLDDAIDSLIQLLRQFPEPRTEEQERQIVEARDRAQEIRYSLPEYKQDNKLNS